MIFGRLFFCYSFSIFASLCFGQPLEHYRDLNNLYGNDQLFLNITQSADLNYLSVGYWDGDVHLAKFDRRGLGTLWEKRLFEGTGHIIYPANHNYGIAGEVGGYLFIARVDEDGNIVKKKVFDDLSWSDINLKPHESGIVVSNGSTILLLDFSGNTIESHVDNEINFKGAFKTVDNHFIAWGSSANGRILIKYDQTFESEWTYNLGSVSVKDATTSSLSGNIGLIYGNVGLKIISNTGELIRDRSIGGWNNDYPRSIKPVLEKDGFYILKGGVDWDIYVESYYVGRVIEVDANGKLAPDNLFSWPIGYSLDILEYSPGNVISLSKDGIWDYYVPNGSHEWNKLRKITRCDWAPHLRLEVKQCGSIVLRASLSDNATYTWYREDIMLSASSEAQLIVTESGTYSYSISKCDEEIFSNEIEILEEDINDPCSCLDYSDLSLVIRDECEIIAEVETSSPIDSVVWSKQHDQDGPFEYFATTESTTISLPEDEGFYVHYYGDFNHHVEAKVYYNGCLVRSASKEKWIVNPKSKLVRDEECNSLLVESVQQGLNVKLQFQWFLNGDSIEGAVYPELPMLEHGNYSVKIKNLCELGPYTFTEENIIDTVNYASQLSENDCTVTLSLPEFPNNSTVWFKDGKLLTSGSNSAVINAGGSSYFAKAFDECTLYISDTVNIIMPLDTTMLITEQTQINCFPRLSLPAAPSEFTKWYKDGELFATGSNSISANTTAIYYAIAKDLCMTYLSDTVTVDEIPNEFLGSLEVESNCEFHEFTFAEAAGNTTWYKDYAPINNQHYDISILRSTSSGTYYAVSDLGSCIYYSDTLYVDPPPKEDRFKRMAQINQNGCHSAKYRFNVEGNISWYVNNELVKEGTDEQYLTVHSNQTIHAIATIGNCTTYSDTVNVSIENNTSLIPNVCEGAIRLHQSLSSLSVEWYRDGTLIEGEDEASLNTQEAASYHAIAFSGICVYYTDTVFFEPEGTDVFRPVNDRTLYICKTTPPRQDLIELIDGSYEDIEVHEKVTYTNNNTFKWFRRYPEFEGSSAWLGPGTYCAVGYLEECIYYSDTFKIYHKFFSDEIDLELIQEGPSTLNESTPTTLSVSIPYNYLEWRKDEEVMTGENQSPLLVTLPGTYQAWVIDTKCTLKSSRVVIDGNPILSVSSAKGPHAYPNPATDILQLNGIKEDELIRVINVAGKIMKSVIYEENSITITELKPGIYFLVIESQNSTVKYIRFIKE